MQDKHLVFLRGALGASLLQLLTVAIAYLARVPLWLPMNGALRFNDAVLKWLVVSIPVGSVLGCATSARRNANLPARIYMSGWFCGCFVGLICFFYLVTWLNYLHPFLICAVGLMSCGFVFYLTLVRSKQKPTRIPRQW